MSEAVMNDSHPCPICDKYEFKIHNSFDDCPVCGWTDDAVQAKDADRTGCANAMSVNEARAAFAEGREVV